MPSYDVVVIGAGAAGLSAGRCWRPRASGWWSLDRSPHLGGRAMAVPDEGFTVNLGGHLIEDPGSGLTKVFEHVGKELCTARSPTTCRSGTTRRAGPRSATATPTAPSSRRSSRRWWRPRTSSLDEWDDRSLREWIHQYTDDQGVVDLFEFISVLECMTDNWYDHSASDNLYVRKMHFEERNTAAYSCWPGQGWDGMWRDLADAITGTAASCGSARPSSGSSSRTARSRASRSGASRRCCRTSSSRRRSSRRPR